MPTLPLTRSTSRGPISTLLLLTLFLPLNGCALFDGEPAPPPCDDGEDNDGDGFIDEEDPQCDSETDFEHVACQDGQDNDLDGLTDAADPACQADPMGDTEGGNECSDGMDNDGDGFEDLADPACLGDALSPEEVEACHNGRDDDLDGNTDAAEDWGCGQDEMGLSEVGAGECDDGEDNDGDGAIDLADPDCQVGRFEEPECSNGVDDDGDNLVDGQDPGCLSDSDPSEAAECENGRDDDLDGTIDLEDEDCSMSPAWDNEAEASCEDGQDNDNDFYPDSTDADCYPLGHFFCSDEPKDYLPNNSEDGSHDGSGGTCSDGEDNNFNGLIDGNESLDVCPHGCALEE